MFACSSIISSTSLLLNPSISSPGINSSNSLFSNNSSRAICLLSIPNCSYLSLPRLSCNFCLYSSTNCILPSLSIIPILSFCLLKICFSIISCPSSIVDVSTIITSSEYPIFPSFAGIIAHCLA